MALFAPTRPAAADMSSAMSSSPALSPLTPNAKLSISPEDDGDSSRDRDRERARAPARYERPYYSPRLARSRSRARPESLTPPTKEYAAHVASVARTRKARAAELGISPHSPGGRDRDGLAVEFVVDVPVWSAGCFADLSTLHALRDTTLQHTHALIAHLQDEYALHASYRLLARRPTAVGWGSVRLAPTFLDKADAEGRRPPQRRTSFVQTEEMGAPASGGSQPIPTPTSASASASPRRTSRSPRGMSMSESALESDDETTAAVKPGYVNAASSDCEEDDEADSLVKAEVDAHGHREGTAFVLELRGVRTLVLV